MKLMKDERDELAERLFVAVMAAREATDERRVSPQAYRAHALDSYAQADAFLAVQRAGGKGER